MGNEAVITVEVLVFGPLEARLGARSVNLSLPAGSTVAALLAALEAAHPKLGSLQGQVAIARNQSYAKPDDLITQGDELALIPPVSGG